MKKIYWRLGGAAFAVAMLATGCGDRKKDERSLAQKSGEAVGRGLREFTGGVGKGVDEARRIPVDFAEELKTQGLSCSIGKTSKTFTSDAALILYVISERPFDGALRVKALNEEGREIGRSRENLTLAADDAQYLSFQFPIEMDMNAVASYQVSLSIKSEAKAAGD